MRPLDPRHVVGVLQAPELLPDQLAAVVSEHPLQRGVRDQEAAPAVDPADADRGLLGDYGPLHGRLLPALEGARQLAHLVLALAVRDRGARRLGHQLRRAGQAAQRRQDLADDVQREQGHHDRDRQRLGRDHADRDRRRDPDPVAGLLGLGVQPAHQLLLGGREQAEQLAEHPLDLGRAVGVGEHRLAEGGVGIDLREEVVEERLRLGQRPPLGEQGGELGGRHGGGHSFATRVSTS